MSGEAVCLPRTAHDGITLIASSNIRRASNVLPRAFWHVPRSVRDEASAATVSRRLGSASRARVWACGGSGEGGEEQRPEATT